MGKAGTISGILISSILVALLWFIRPWYQPLIVFLYKTPILFEAIGIFVLLAIVTVWKMNTEILEKHGQVIGNALLFSIIPIFFIGVMLSGSFAQVTMSQKVLDKSTEINELPSVDADRPRVLPRTVAEEYAENSLQQPRYQLGESDIAIQEKGKPYWSMPLSPDGLFNHFLIKQKGASFVDMTTSTKNIEYSDAKMKYGLGMGITDNVMWQLKKENYLVEYRDPKVLKHDGETYIAVPYVNWDYHFRFPVVYTTPKWAGVALVDSEGETQFLSPEEAETNEVLEDQVLYPHDLSRKYVSSLAYKRGILNAWFFHRDQLEVASVPGQGNNQPFTVLTEDGGAKEFVATEPYGRASGLFQLWLIDAQTGEYEVFKLNRSEALLGADKATNYVRKANSRVNWADRGGETTTRTGFEPSEPLPVLVDNKLYWQVRVVPIDSAGIAFTSFVDAHSGDVYTAQNDEEIVNFIKTGELEEKKSVNGTQPQQPGEQPSEGEIKITVTEGGEVVDTITVTENQTIEIERSE